MNPIDAPQPSSDTAALVREGMEVYDVDNQHVGTVDMVHSGEVTPAAEAAGLGPGQPSTDAAPSGSLVGDVLGLFNPVDTSETAESRLLQKGFVRIGRSGLFSSARYVTLDQVAAVEGDRVLLNVRGENLIKD